MILSRKKKIKAEKILWNWKIKRNCLHMIFACSQSNYPNEFGGLLRVGTEAKDTIVEIVVLPGTISGDAHAIFQLHMLPIDFTIVGTAHSHPSYSPAPSKADRYLFEKYGKVHIIVAYPFTQASWQAYDHYGNEISMTVI